MVEVSLKSPLFHECRSQLKVQRQITPPNTWLSFFTFKIVQILFVFNPIVSKEILLELLQKIRFVVEKFFTFLLFLMFIFIFPKKVLTESLLRRFLISFFFLKPSYRFFLRRFLRQMNLHLQLFFLNDKKKSAEISTDSKRVLYNSLHNP